MTLFCTADQLTGFYMRATLGFNGLTKRRSKVRENNMSRDRALSFDQ